MTILKNVLFFSLVIFMISCQEGEMPITDKPDDEVPSVTSLKIMAYNVHYCNPPSMASSFIDIDAVVNVINGEKPDLVALQEIDVNTNRSGNINQAQLLASKLHMRYFFAKAIDFQGGDYGVLILSKYPISETTTHRLPTQPGSGGEPRVLATAKITLPDGNAIRFGSTHLDAQTDDTNRRLQIDRLIEVSGEQNLPFIVGADLNAVPNSDVIGKFDAYFTRSCSACPPTFPAINPNRVIDYIAFKHPEDKFSVKSHYVVNEAYSSDHRPIVAIIEIKE